MLIHSALVQIARLYGAHQHEAYYYGRKRRTKVENESACGHFARFLGAQARYARDQAAANQGQYEKLERAQKYLARKTEVGFRGRRKIRVRSQYEAQANAAYDRNDGE